MSIKQFIFATVASVLIFLLVSYASFLFAGTGEEYSEENVGFPFTFYKRFWVDPPFHNSNGYIEYLFLDALITWTVTIGIFYWLIKKRKINV